MVEYGDIDIYIYKALIIMLIFITMIRWLLLVEVINSGGSRVTVLTIYALITAPVSVWLYAQLPPVNSIRI